MFQSSWTSWSSKIIVVGTVESSQRMSGSRPRFAVEAGVLLEVGDLLAGRLLGVAPAPDEVERRRRDLVRVDLVAEEQDRIGPLDLAALELLRVRPERVDAGLSRSRATAREPVGWGRRCGTSRTRGATAAGSSRADDRSRSSVLGRPDRDPVKPHVVGRDGRGLEVVDEKQRVVMAFDGERAGAVGEDLDLAGRARLDPERRALGTCIPEHGTEHEFGHVALARTRVMRLGAGCGTRSSDAPVARFHDREDCEGDEARGDRPRSQEP